MGTEPDPSNPTLLAALYQVTARWYANDAQLVWRRLTLFVTLNTGLIAAQEGYETRVREGGVTVFFEYSTQC
jgi:hypothetical protein